MPRKKKPLPPPTGAPSGPPEPPPPAKGLSRGVHAVAAADPEAALDAMRALSEGVHPEVEPPPEEATAFQAAQVRRLVAEQARRAVEALRLYEPLPEQLAFHASRAKTRLLRGSNRGGKTLPAAGEVARALTGRDPYAKYPAEEGRCFAVGKNLDHCGSVMWRKLSRGGAFKVIRDALSGRWRAYRPFHPEDLARAEEARPVGPLIPPRLIRSIAWENKAKSIPKKVLLATGWEIDFYSSEGKPPQGSDIDLWWFDEEIVDPDWFPEMVARVLDRGGRGIWSATPQAGTERLLELHERAELEQHQAHKAVEEFVILLRNNPHIPQHEKEELAAALGSDRERMVRIDGEFVVNTWRVYPEWQERTHLVPWFQIPSHWTRYASIDPGRQVCAVLFLAVPPPGEGGDRVHLYDELYLTNCDAEEFGRAMARKAHGQTFTEFLIDMHGGRLTDIGSGLSVAQQYSRALRRNRVSSLKTGHWFRAGHDDPESGVESFRSWLKIREDGTPLLAVLQGKCPNLEWEIRHYRYQRKGEVVTDKPEERGRVHQMANCRYLASRQPKYVPRPRGKGRPSGALAAFRAKQQRQAKRQGGGPQVRLGPGSKGE